MNNSTENKANQSPKSEKSPLSSNIWGWKFSFISLGFLLFMIAIAAYRHWQLGVPVSLENVQVEDSTKMKNERMKNERMKNERMKSERMKSERMNNENKDTLK